MGWRRELHKVMTTSIVQARRNYVDNGEIGFDTYNENEEVNNIYRD